MALLVKNIDNSLQYIPNYCLEEMLSTGRIAAFKRSSGEWVDPAVGPLRGSSSIVRSYTGPERRSRW